MSTLKTISTTTPRETDGASTSKRYSYQHAWALISILDAHQTDKEYIFLLEYLDDIVHWDENTPNEANFVQIKTLSAKQWTPASLCKKKNELSPLDKLFDHLSQHKQSDLKLHFVSDAPFNFMTDIGQINAGELDEDIQSKILKSIQEKYPETTGEDLKKLYFERSRFTQNTFNEFLTGHTLETFHKLLGDESPNYVKTWLTAWKDEVLRKSNDDSKIHNEEDLLKKKSIRRADIEESLKLIRNGIQYKNEAWPFIEKFLYKESFNPISILKLKKAWDESITKCMDASDELNQELLGIIQKKLQNYSINDEQFSFLSLLEDLTKTVKDSLSINPYTIEYIQASILREWYEQTNNETE